MNSMQILEVIVSVTVQATIVFAASAALCRVAANDEARCRIWTCCFSVLLVLCSVAMALPHLRPVYPWESMDRELGAYLLQIGRHLGWWLAILWGSGASYLLLITAGRWWRIIRFLRRCDDARLEDMPDVHARVLVSDEAATPSCWQFQIPFIVLPRFAFDFDRTQLQFILRHEAAHLRLGHPLQLLLQRAIEVIFWFHPMTWWASRQADLAREFACDDAALDDPSQGADYLRTLMLVVERVRRVPPGVLTIGSSTSVMTLRARRLARFANKTSSPRQVVPIGCLTAALVAMAVVISFVWVPVDLQASPINKWSPCPTWSANVLHSLGVEARDFEGHECRFESVDEWADGPLSSR